MNNDSRKKNDPLHFLSKGSTGSVAFPFGQIKLRSSQTISESHPLQGMERHIWWKVTESVLCVCTCTCVLPHLTQMKLKCKKTMV